MTKRLELEHLVKIRPVGPGNWSADGRYVAFVWADRSGIPYLWACSSNGGWPRRLTKRPVILEMPDGTDRRDVWGGPQWSSAAPRVAFLSPASLGSGVSIWTVGPDGAEAVEVTRHVSDDRTPRWSPDGQRIAFVGHRDGRDDIQVVPADGGIALQLTYDRWDNTDLDWSPDGRWIAFISQRSNEDLFSNNICLVPTDGGEVVRLTDDESANDRSPRWSPNGHTIAFVSNRADTDDIWCIEANGTNLRRLTEGGSEKGDPRWSPDGRWIAYREYCHGDINILAIPAPGGDPRLIASGGVNQAPRWSPDGRQLLYLRSGPSQSEDLWIKPVDAEPSDPGRQITHADLGMLDGIQFSEPEVVTYQSSGFEIEGLLYHPTERLEEPGPAIVWVHGGPNAVHSNGWHPLIQYLAQRGYTLFAPNYRGSTGYGKAFMEGNIGVGMGVDLDDCVAAATLLRTMPLVDDDRIAIMGRSAGGQITLLALGQAPEVFRAGVAIAAPSNRLSYWEETRMSWTRRWRAKAMGLPIRNFELYRRRSAVRYASAFQAPVLILHGEEDPGVPSGQAREMAAALEQFSKTHECQIYPGEGHSFIGPEAILDSTARIERFLNTHCGFHG